MSLPAINVALHLASIVRYVNSLAGLKARRRHCLKPVSEHIQLSEGLCQTAGVEAYSIRLLRGRS